MWFPPDSLLPKKKTSKQDTSLSTLFTLAPAGEGKADDHSCRLKGVDLQPCQGDKEDVGRGDAF